MVNIEIQKTLLNQRNKDNLKSSMKPILCIYLCLFTYSAIVLKFQTSLNDPTCHVSK